MGPVEYACMALHASIHCDDCMHDDIVQLHAVSWNQTCMASCAHLYICFVMPLVLRMHRLLICAAVDDPCKLSIMSVGQHPKSRGPCQTLTMLCAGCSGGRQPLRRHAAAAAGGHGCFAGVAHRFVLAASGHAGRFPICSPHPGAVRATQPRPQRQRSRAAPSR